MFYKAIEIAHGGIYFKKNRPKNSMLLSFKRVVQMQDVKGYKSCYNKKSLIFSNRCQSIPFLNLKLRPVTNFYLKFSAPNQGFAHQVAGHFQSMVLL